MIKITQEDLVRYLYKETSASKTARIQEALQIDNETRDEFEKIRSTLATLGEATHAPRQETVDKILEYASTTRSQLHSF